MVSRAILPASLTVPPEILRLVTTVRMSFSEPLVWSGVQKEPRSGVIGVEQGPLIPMV